LRASRRKLWCQRIRSGGHRDARYITGAEAIAPIVRELAKPGDFVVFLGAGNITQWAYALPKELASDADTPKI
jgi:UDP-N-acetylmuramate--alanine ligase